MTEKMMKILASIVLAFYIISTSALIICSLIPTFNLNNIVSVTAMICSACVSIVALICLTVYCVQCKRNERSTVAGDSETKELLKQIKDAFTGHDK